MSQQWEIITNYDTELNNLDGLDIARMVNEKTSEMLQMFEELSGYGFKVVAATAKLGKGVSVTIRDKETLNDKITETS